MPTSGVLHNGRALLLQRSGGPLGGFLSPAGASTWAGRRPAVGLRCVASPPDCVHSRLRSTQALTLSNLADDGRAAASGLTTAAPRGFSVFLRGSDAALEGRWPGGAAAALRYTA